MSSGSSVPISILVAILAFFLIRWLWATFHRTRYWLSRGTKGIHSEYCPNCQRNRYRTSGDWILKCHKCGWVSGLSVLRWGYRSVPAIQFKRSVSKFGAFAVGFGTAILFNSPPTSMSAWSVQFPSPSLGPINLPSVEQFVLALIIILILGAAILWAMRPRQYFCQNCGQDLGRGNPPEHCPKCGSNRFTNEDPGVGEKVRVQHVD